MFVANIVWIQIKKEFYILYIDTVYTKTNSAHLLSLLYIFIKEITKPN